MSGTSLQNYDRSLNHFLATVSHLGVTAILSDQSPSIVQRAESVLQRIYAEVRGGRLADSKCMQAIGAQLAIVQGKPPVIEELLWAYDVSRGLRRRPESDDRTVLNATDQALLTECEAILKDTWVLCERRVENARRALGILEQATIHISNAGGVVDRRAVPSGLRIFISYAHEDKLVAEFVNRRLLNGGVETWLDDTRLAAGAALPLEISEQIRRCSHFVVLLTPASVRSKWVEQECSWALTNEINNGTPHVIPLLYQLNENPSYLSDRRAISITFDDHAISQIWKAIGVPERANWSLSEVGKLLRMGKRLLAAVEWCGTADGWRTVHENTFEDLEDSEAYLNSLGLLRKGYSLVRFARTSEVQSEHIATAMYSEDFYGFTNSYIAGTVLLSDLTLLIDELLESTARAQTGDENALKTQSAKTS